MGPQTTDKSPIFATFGRRKVRACVCIVDRKAHIRTFLRNALEELELSCCECSDKAELEAVLRKQLPDLVVLGLPAGGEDGIDVLNTLAAKEFAGKVLLLGPRVSPMLRALQEFGRKLRLAMLPALSTPFGSGNLRDRVAILLPVNVPQPAVELTEALSEGWLELWYQPKVDTRTVTFVGAEAMVRLRHPSWGVVTPAYFLPDGDDPRLRALSDFTIAQAARDWLEFLVESGPVELAINLPLSVLQDQDSIIGFCRKMPNHPAFEGLIIEINALEVIRNLEQAKAAARLLRFHNIGISIDNLGVEWPTLMDIEDFPFIEIKVDRKFVSGCGEDNLKQALCRRILDLAQRYGARSVAEGVDTIADLVAVRGMGFDLVQGSLFSGPVPANRFARTVLLRRTGLGNAGAES